MCMWISFTSYDDPVVLPPRVFIYRAKVGTLSPLVTELSYDLNILNHKKLIIRHIHIYYVSNYWENSAILTLETVRIKREPNQDCKMGENPMWYDMFCQIMLYHIHMHYHGKDGSQHLPMTASNFSTWVPQPAKKFIQ